MARELRNKEVWCQCSFEHPPPRWTRSQFITDLGKNARLRYGQRH